MYQLTKEQQRYLVADAGFDESKHPRDKSGKFGSGGGSKKAGSGKAPVRTPPAMSQMAAKRAGLDFTKRGNPLEMDHVDLDKGVMYKKEQGRKMYYRAVKTDKGKVRWYLDPSMGA